MAQNAEYIIPINDTSRYLQSDAEDYDGNSGNGGDLFIDFESGFTGFIAPFSYRTGFTA
jgi:hypothetical protein